MDRASEAILALEPVTFRYKPDLDPNGVPQFGLVAEQVEKVNPDLVVRGQDGKVNTVRYEAVNAMLLNEFLKAHRKLDQQQAMIDR
jgi:Chaperone of endosialidase